jgi:hypothetical protein
MGDKLEGLALEAQQLHHGHGPGSLDLDPHIAAELGLVDVLHAIKGQLQAGTAPPGMRKIILSNAGSEAAFRGNPVDWIGPAALAVMIWNPNTFAVDVGHGAGGGTPASRMVQVPPRTLACLPLASEIYSFGTQNALAADAEIFVARYHEPIPPFMGEFGTVPAGTAADPMMGQVVGDSGSGVADPSTNPVKVGGRALASPPVLADNTRFDLMMGTRGSVKVQLQAPDSVNTFQWLSAEADAHANTAVILTGSDTYVYNGVNWDRLRAPVKFVPIPATAIVAGTGVTIWTPAASKKFRLMGWLLSYSVAAQLIFGDNLVGTVIARTELLAAAGISKEDNIGNGILSALANNVLKLDATVGGSVSGMVWGTEE